MGDVAEFVARDGTILRGEVAGAGPVAIVLVHDVDDDIDIWRPIWPELAESGFRVVMFDQRGHGCSDGSADVSLLSSDVEDVVDRVRSVCGRVGLCAAGESCTALWGVAVTSGSIGVVAVGAASGPGHDVPRCPVMAIYARDDDAQSEVARRVRAHHGSMIAGVPGSFTATELLRGSGNGLAGYVRMFFAAVSRLGYPTEAGRLHPSSDDASVIPLEGQPGRHDLNL